MAVTSFKSKHYPRTGQPLVILQEYAMRYYAGYALLVMIAVIIRMTSGLGVFWVGIGGAAFAIAMGNISALVASRNRRAEIFFVGESFSLISVHEILFKKPNRSFPLRFASPFRQNPDEIHVHFQDEVVVLRREEWDDLDLIWEWLNPTQVNYSMS